MFFSFPFAAFKFHQYFRLVAVNWCFGIHSLRVFDPDFSGRGSRSYMDVDKRCLLCNSDDEDMIFCDTCLNGFCAKCKQFKGEGTWLCEKCSALQDGSVKSIL